jgi:hypothetical protein
LTNTAIQFGNREKASRYLPPLTICPLPAYKEKGFHFRNQTFMNYTFTKEEVFSPFTLDKLKKDKPFFAIKEIQSLMLGRCFTIKM